MIRNYFRFGTRRLTAWFWTCITALFIQMYFSTGTLSGYAATLEKPAVYKGYYVNYDWPLYVSNYKFIMGADHQEWEHGAVLRRMLLYIIGYPWMRLFGFFVGSMITILLILILTIYFFSRFLEKKFGEFAAITGTMLICTYSGIMYWIGSPFVHNLIVPICIWVYILLYGMSTGGLKSNIRSLIIMGILFTGYDLLPLLGPGIFLFILFNNHFNASLKIILLFVFVIAMLLPQLLIQWWLGMRGLAIHNSNDDTYRIILNSYIHIGQQIPAWINRVKLIPDTFIKCFFHSNFFVLPIFFLICWIIGRLNLKFKMNLVECSLLTGIVFLFLFNNMSPPYEGEWQMWGDWLARLYQAAFIVYLLYIIRLSAYVINHNRGQIIFKSGLFIAIILNLSINLGGLAASPLTSYVYYCFYKHGKENSYSLNIKYYGARPLGFPVHYETEIK